VGRPVQAAGGGAEDAQRGEEETGTGEAENIKTARGDQAGSVGGEEESRRGERNRQDAVFDARDRTPRQGEEREM
jgi:hypothetical protein